LVLFDVFGCYQSLSYGNFRGCRDGRNNRADNKKLIVRNMIVLLIEYEHLCNLSQMNVQSSIHGRIERNSISPRLRQALSGEGAALLYSSSQRFALYNGRSAFSSVSIYTTNTQQCFGSVRSSFPHSRINLFIRSKSAMSQGWASNIPVGCSIDQCDTMMVTVSMSSYRKVVWTIQNRSR